MERTVTVKGVGRISRKPDQVVIEMRLEALDKDYETAMGKAADDVSRLKKGLVPACFAEEDLKTVQFNVTTQYRSQTDENGRYIEVFEGYQVTHALKAELDFDKEQLAKSLIAITGTGTNPRIDIRFCVKDQAEASDALLLSASQNALRKAQILTQACNAGLGRLLQIDYNWSDVRFFSETSYRMHDQMLNKEANVPDIEPDDILLSDAAAFVWELI